MARRAVVIGGSLGGLFTAAFLQQLGWQVDIYERVADDLATRGAGLGTHDALLDALAALGVGRDEHLGILVSERICLDTAGQVVARRTLPQVMSHWARIYGALRPLLLPQAQPRYAGYVGWRGTVTDIDLPHEYYFVLPRGEMMLTYPVPTGEWNYVWYRPTTERELAKLCTDSTGHCHGTAIAPPLIREEFVATLKRDARSLLAPQLVPIVERSRPFFQAIFDLESPRIVQGRAVLLGDAAFVARPHVGMGVTKGSLDARCLARSIELAGDDLDAALERYDRLRCEFGRWCVNRSRSIGAYIEQRALADPARVLSEVGAVRADVPITY